MSDLLTISLMNLLQTTMLYLQDYISSIKLDEHGYVYMKPADWDSSKGGNKPKTMSTRKNIPNNSKLQFEGRKRVK